MQTKSWEGLSDDAKKFWPDQAIRLNGIILAEKERGGYLYFPHMMTRAARYDPLNENIL